MNLGLAVERYIAMKRTLGFDYNSCGKVLWSFAKPLRDMPLENVSQEHVLIFLSGPRASRRAWHRKYAILRNFFLHWIARQQLDEMPMPPRLPVAEPSRFTPHIYTQAEIGRILDVIATCPSEKRKIAPVTLRTFLIVLYASGALVSEVQSLMCTDVDLRARTLTFCGSHWTRPRTVPINRELSEILRSYFRFRSNVRCSHFFIDKDGKGIRSRTLLNSFERIRDQALVQRLDSNPRKPRMQDLRYAFAVHRLDEWFRSRTDLSQMIPALSAYIGQVKLEAMDRYLRWSSERFREHLNTLSPRPNRRRWCEDPTLMKFLEEL
jgi:site-specific recombinase XerD